MSDINNARSVALATLQELASDKHEPSHVRIEASRVMLQAAGMKYTQVATPTVAPSK